MSHPDVRRIAFTGSTAVGRHVATLAAPDLKRLTLELGGSDPVIICADADVDAAVKAVIIGRYWNAGQACLGCKRVFVHDSVYDGFVSQLVERVGRYEPGDGTVKAEKPKLRMGPIHTRQGRDELLEQIEDGVAKGGELLIGGGTTGQSKGFFLEPAVIAEPSEASRLMHEEVFGPVLPVSRFTDFDDAITRANDTPYGLGSSIWTHDARLIHRAAQEIESGMTWVNQIHYGYDELPFGGVKASGYGKEHGIESLDSLRRDQVGGRGRSRVNGCHVHRRRADRLHHARQAAGQLVRPRVHERVLRGGRSGRRRQPRAWSSSRAETPSSSPPAPTSRSSSRATSARTWR